MPTPKKYANRQELISALKQYAWLDWFKSGRMCEENSDLQLIIRNSVGPNIFRAFRHLPARPSVIFREWAFESFRNKFLSNFRKLDSRAQYREWLYSVSDSMQQCWKRSMGVAMALGPSLKLPNLIAKRLCLFRNVPFSEFERLVWFLEIPLDIYTIQAVANCVVSFRDHEAIGPVPRTATMGFITNRRMYEAFQEGILQLANEAKVPAIALDCLAWDSRHLG